MPCYSSVPLASFKSSSLKLHVCSHLLVSHKYLLTWSYSQYHWLIILQMQSQVLLILFLTQLYIDQKKPTSLRLTREKKKNQRQTKGKWSAEIRGKENIKCKTIFPGPRRWTGWPSISFLSPFCTVPWASKQQEEKRAAGSIQWDVKETGARSTCHRTKFPAKAQCLRTCPQARGVTRLMLSQGVGTKRYMGCLTPVCLLPVEI